MIDIIPSNILTFTSEYLGIVHEPDRLLAGGRGNFNEAEAVYLGIDAPPPTAPPRSDSFNEAEAVYLGIAWHNKPQNSRTRRSFNEAEAVYLGIA